MTLKVRTSSVTGEFEQAFRDKYKPLAEAGTEAVRQVADSIKASARADIAAAGFGKRWQNALRVDIYPKRGVSLNAAALVYHKIPYADIFETGGAISGKPRVWIPLTSTPKKLGRERLSAKLFASRIGELHSLNRPGKPPLLMAPMAVSKAQAKSGQTGKITLAKLRKGAAKAGIVRAVPLFVGVSTVTLKDKFSIREIIAKAVGKLASVYADKVSAKDLEG